MLRIKHIYCFVYYLSNACRFPLNLYMFHIRMCACLYMFVLLRFFRGVSASGIYKIFVCVWKISATKVYILHAVWCITTQIYLHMLLYILHTTCDLRFSSSLWLWMRFRRCGKPSDRYIYIFSEYKMHQCSAMKRICLPLQYIRRRSVFDKMHIRNSSCTHLYTIEFLRRLRFIAYPLLYSYILFILDKVISPYIYIYVCMFRIVWLKIYKSSAKTQIKYTIKYI